MEKYFEEFVTAAHSMAQKQLVLCSCGNLSWRIDDGRMLITATDSWMENLTKDDVSLCRIADCSVQSQAKPSKEIGFHAAILRQRSDIDVVLHFQTPYATAVACRREKIKNFSVIPEVAYYVGPVASVPYFDPGSAELAEATASAMTEHDLVLLRNHGQVTVGKTFDAAITKATFFELACQIILAAGCEVEYIPDAAASELRRLYKSSLNRKSSLKTMQKEQ